MGHQDADGLLAGLSPAERAQAEELLELAKTNPRHPIYGAFPEALRIGSRPVVAAWLNAHASGRPYAAADPLWQRALRELQKALTLEEHRERASMGLSTDETDIANEEYFHDLMNRDD